MPIFLSHIYYKGALGSEENYKQAHPLSSPLGLNVLNYNKCLKAK